jgi:hypothetical protein
LAACGASQQGAEGGDDLYPVVTDPLPEYGETVTVGGAMVSKPVKPTEYETEPSPSCERQPYKSASGGGLMIVPPRPGLSAKAVSERSVEVSWRFEEVPDDCRPVSVLVSIVANDAPTATPTTVTVPYGGETGTATVDTRSSCPARRRARKHRHGTRPTQPHREDSDPPLVPTGNGPLVVRGLDGVGGQSVRRLRARLTPRR